LHIGAEWNFNRLLKLSAGKAKAQHCGAAGFEHWN
jgi:hypothetical protein